MHSVRIDPNRPDSSDHEEEETLSESELESFREQLEQKRGVLRRALRGAMTPEDREHAVDTLDVALDEYQSSFDNRIRDRARLLLRKVEHALDRIAAGEFDECVDCGESIGRRRLNVRPEATRCIECKEAQEVMERGYAHRRDLEVSFEFES